MLSKGIGRIPYPSIFDETAVMWIRDAYKEILTIWRK